ncbi:MarR family transcriptional regulator, partial [Streptomyces sp. SID7499]|nr:MarR family transcriptional regulator [Streptomyces sp. SID7499]
MTIHKQPRAASDQTMWEAVLGLHAFVERQLAHTLQRRYGVGLSEYRALEALTQAENGECRMQELADHIGLGQSSVTRLVGR